MNPQGKRVRHKLLQRTICLALPLLITNLAAAQSVTRADALALEQQGRNREAEQIWKSIAQAEPKNPEAFAHIGLLEAREQHYQEAIASYRQAIELDPAMPGLRMNLGLALFKADQFPAAIKVFSAELRKHPGDDRLIILLGMSHFGMGDYLVAIPYLKKAAESDPQSLPLRLTLAHSCLWSKQYECVMSVYKEILILNPDSAEADMLAGEALDEKGDDAGAMEQFRAATKANAKEPNAHFGLGYLLWKQHHYDEAAKEFQAEVDNNPAQLQASAYLGDCLVELNQYDQALAILEKTVHQSPAAATPAMVYRDLGIVYAEAGRKDEATGELEKAIALDPKDVSSHWRLARLYQSMGRKDEAKAEFDIASSMNKENSRPLTQEIGDSHPGAQP